MTGNRLLADIRSGNFAGPMHEHSLGDGDAAWHAKYLGYVKARQRFERRRQQQQASPAPPSGTRDVLRWAKRPLRWLNVILGSLGDAIPVAGSAYKELKDTTEATIDDVLDDDDGGFV
jgi:hypothetical protein